MDTALPFRENSARDSKPRAGALKQLWKSGLKIGYDRTAPGLEKSRIMLLNGIMIATSVSVLIYAVAYWIINYQYFYGPLYILPVTIGVLYLNHNRKFKAAQNVYFLGSLLVISYWCYEGRGNGNEYALITLATTATLIFNRKIEAFTTNVLCGGVFLIYKIYDSSVPFIPDPSINYAVLPSIILVNSVAIVSFQIGFFRDLVRHYDSKLLIKYREQDVLIEGQKIAEEELKTSNEKLQDMTEHLEIMVKQKTSELQTYIKAINVSIFSTISDLNGCFIEVNEQVVAMSGYSRKELIGSHYDILASGRHTHQFFKERRRTLMHGKTWRGEVEHKTKAGALLWFDCVVIPIYDSSETISSFLTLGLPVTERKLREKIREDTHALLETIAFGASHKIRGPLASIKGLTNLVQKELINDEEFKLVAEKLLICSEELNMAASELVSFVEDHQDSIQEPKVDTDK